MIFAAALALGFLSPAPVDELFLRTSAEDTIAELRIVGMAVNRTRHPGVKRACEIMIRDHTRALGEIRSLGKRLGIDLPTEPNAKHQALFRHLSSQKGREFDKSLVGDQIQDHIGDVNDAQDEVEVGVDASLRDFAKHGVKMFARHEVIWRGVARSVGVEPTYGRPSSEQILAGKKL